MSAPITCCATVAKEKTGWRRRYAPCSRPGKVEREGKWYCGQHDPEAQEAKRQATHDRWSAKAAETAREQCLIAAAPDLLDALLNVRSLISEAAETGFNWKDGNWAERLFFSQQKTSAAIARAKGEPT